MIYLKFKNGRAISVSSSGEEGSHTYPMPLAHSFDYVFFLFEGTVAAYKGEEIVELYYDEATNTTYPYEREGTVRVGKGRMDASVYRQHDGTYGFSEPQPLKLYGVEYGIIRMSATKRDQDGLTAVFVDYLSDPENFEDTVFVFSNGDTLLISKENILEVKRVWKAFRKQVLSNG